MEGRQRVLGFVFTRFAMLLRVPEGGSRWADGGRRKAEGAGFDLTRFAFLLQVQEGAAEGGSRLADGGGFVFTRFAMLFQVPQGAAEGPAQPGFVAAQEFERLRLVGEGAESERLARELVDELVLFGDQGHLALHFAVDERGLPCPAALEPPPGGSELEDKVILDSSGGLEFMTKAVEEVLEGVGIPGGEGALAGFGVIARVLQGRGHSSEATIARVWGRLRGGLAEGVEFTRRIKLESA